MPLAGLAYALAPASTSPAERAAEMAQAGGAREVDRRPERRQERLGDRSERHPCKLLPQLAGKRVFAPRVVVHLDDRLVRVLQRLRHDCLVGAREGVVRSRDESH
jgi:hypothetical protein